MANYRYLPWAINTANRAFSTRQRLFRLVVFPTAVAGFGVPEAFSRPEAKAERLAFCCSVRQAMASTRNRLSSGLLLLKARLYEGFLMTVVTRTFMPTAKECELPTTHAQLVV
jgi:hypothetical protein